MPTKVCVFGSSAKTTPTLFLDEAFKLGQLLAEKGVTCVNGGGTYSILMYKS